MDTTMADEPLVRRSGRARKTVTSYAEEQAQDSTTSAPPAKRKKTSGEASKDELMRGYAVTKSESTQIDEQNLPHYKTKRVKVQPNDDWTDAAAVKADPEEDGGDFQPAPKKRKKSTKRAKAIGKLDSEGVMRLDTTQPRPPGERIPPRVYEVPPQAKGTKDKGINLSQILAENFEERWERKTSRIKRLGPGQQEVRLKK